MEVIEFQNNLEGKDDDILCRCNDFGEDLMNLSNDILLLSKEDVNQQWEKFKEYLIKYRRKFEASTEFGVWWKPCSLKIVSMILDRLEQLRCCGMPLSYLLLNLITAINSYIGDFNINLRCHFMNSIVINFSSPCEIQVLCALRGKPNFMELLVHFGFVSSLSDESSHLQKATHDLMENFL